IWQSNRSRSTGWHNPAVPPARSASQPGENTSEQPIGKCGPAPPAGCCGVRCRATTSLCVARSTRSALPFTALRCFMPLLYSTHPFGRHRLVELREKRRIPLGKLTVDLQAHVGPAADPVAVMQVRPRRLAVPRMGFVVAAAGAERPGPARAAVGFVRDVMLLEERVLRVPVDAVGARPQFVRVGAGEAVTQGDISVGRDAHEPESRAAWKRFAHAFVDLFQRLLDVREAVMPVRDRVLEELVCEIPELAEHVVVALLGNGVTAARRRRHRRKADLPETDLLGEMTINPLDVERPRGERDACADWPAPVLFEELADFRSDHVVAARTVVEDAELVLHLAGTVDGDGDADAVLGEELDDLRLQQRAVGREAEVHVLAQFGAAPARVRDRLLQNREVEQRLAAKEGDVRHPVVARFLEHELHALTRGLLAHELRFPAVFRVDDLVFAVLVTVGAAQVALVGDVEDHRRQREGREREDLRLRFVLSSGNNELADCPDARQFRDRVLELCVAVPLGQLRFELLARVRAGGQPPHDGIRRVVEREDGGARHQIHERPSRCLEAMMFPRGPTDHFPSPAENHAMYTGTVTSSCPRARSGFGDAPVGASSATTQTSPTLFRLPLRFGFGPSTLGVKRPFWSIVPTNCVSSSPKVAVYSSNDHLTSTIPRSRSSGVSGFPSGPLCTPTASNCCSCFGNTAPPTRAIPA